VWTASALREARAAGDTIELSGRWAKISKIGLRSTTIRTLDQADVIVPNADRITNQVTNWTLTDRHARAIITVKVANGSDVSLVMQTLRECALAHPGVMKSPEPRIFFRSFRGRARSISKCTPGSWRWTTGCRSKVICVKRLIAGFAKRALKFRRKRGPRFA
jgi:small-conductance mechanosensitive channel